MSDIEKNLDLCIEKRRLENISIDEVLKDYPQHAGELRPLLELTDKLNALPAPTPSVEMLLQRIAELSLNKERPAHREKKWRAMTNVMLRVAAVVVLILSIGIGSAYASTDALPGDLLYPLKRLTEKVRFILTITNRNKAELRLVFSDK
ncbi:MAG: hypothetical protein WC071_04690, partial [Victivallaceae bacterium]